MAGISAALLCSVALLSAQQHAGNIHRHALIAPGAAEAEQLAHDPLAGNFFPPELIMQNQQGLGLSEEQKNAIIGEIQRTQGQATAVQWRLQQQVERLGSLVKQPRVEETQVLAQLDSVLTVEREMKHLQIGMLVRLKNRLTPEQQAYLRERMPGPR
jgi:Spy/CpxP family protein refolding chaperone